MRYSVSQQQQAYLLAVYFAYLLIFIIPKEKEKR